MIKNISDKPCRMMWGGTETILNPGETIDLGVFLNDRFIGKNLKGAVIKVLPEEVIAKEPEPIIEADPIEEEPEVIKKKPGCPAKKR